MPQLHKHFNVVRHAMKNLSIFISLLTLQLAAHGQKDWLLYNDSTITKTVGFYSTYCASLNSSKKINKEQIKFDQKLIELANKLYNDVSTVAELDEVTKRFKKSVRSGKDTKTSISFRLISDGNLRLTLEAAEANDTLIRKRISIGTNSKTGCALAP